MTAGALLTMTVGGALRMTADPWLYRERQGPPYKYSTGVENPLAASRCLTDRDRDETAATGFR
jgi:hypothetical protein